MDATDVLAARADPMDEGWKHGHAKPRGKSRRTEARAGRDSEERREYTLAAPRVLIGAAPV